MCKFESSQKDESRAQSADSSTAGVTNLFETENYFLVQIHAKGYQFDTHTSDIKICSICLQLCYQEKLKIFIHVKTFNMFFAIVRTSPRATNVVRAGDLVLAGTMLVTLLHSLQKT